MIKINNISKKFKKNKVLRNINLSLENNIYALLGPNGSGKTTFIRIIAGLLKQTTGTIDFNKERKNIKIGYLPQKFGTFKDISVYDQMEYFAVIKEIDKKLVKSEISKVLELVNLIDVVDKKCNELSGGMIRRLGIAQAILGKPDILLLDEPTVGLDVEEQIRFKNILLQIKNDYPIILSTHIVEDVKSVCDNLIIIDKGHIKYNGDLNNFLNVAKNHVFTTKRTNINLLDKYYIINNVINHEDDDCRILCNETHNYLYPEKPTIEDAYLYIIKGFYNEE